MSALLSKFIAWCASFFHDEKNETSSKRLVLICTVFTFLGMCVGLTCAVMADVREASSTLQLLIVTVGSMATGGYLGGKAIESKKPLTK